MFTVLKTRAGLATNPWDEMPAQDSETEGRRNFTSEELEKVCAKAEGTLRYWICIGLYTGLRLGDVVTLKWDEIDFRSHRITRRPSKTRRKDKVLTIPLHPVLESMLKELKRTADKGDSHLFAEDAERHQRGQSSTITQLIQEHFRKCGIETTESADDLHRKKAIVRVGFHSLRHSFVSLCAANRVPQVAIQELVGHGSPAMTALYSHAGDEQKEQAIAALPDMSFENAEESEQPRKKTRRRKLAAKPK
jgi:integrase